MATAGSPPRWRRRLLVGAGVASIVWLVAAGVQVALAAGETQTGLSSLEELRATGSEDVRTFVSSIGGPSDDLPEESAAATLRASGEDFSGAADRLGSVVVAPLRLVPVLGRQLRSAEALSTAAAQVAAAGSTAFDAMTVEGERVSQTPGERLAAGQRTQVVLDTLREDLSELDLGPSEALVGPIARARDRFEEEYTTLMSTLDDASTALRGVTDFLEGPTSYLVLASNNAEMRAGSGMPLQVGVLSAEDGELTLGEFVPSEELLSATPGATLDPDIAANWGWLLPNQEWRNLNASPRFDETARMATEMWAAAGNGEVDGVMSLDAVGLANLLEITGPVEVPGSSGEPGTGTEVTSENVLDDLLLQQYSDFGFDRDARRERLGRVAESIFGAFNTRSFSTSALLEVLQRSGDGRHLMLWSDVPVQQQGWEALGASGLLPDDALMLSVLNRQGNKLDQFLGVDAEITATTEGDLRRVEVRTTLTNTTPDGLPAYVVGPHPAATVAPGDYGGILALTVPAGAGNPRVTGAPMVVAGDDGPTRVVGADVTVPRGASVEVTFGFDLPTSWTGIEIEASARVPAVNWSAGRFDWTDDQSDRLDFANIP